VAPVLAFARATLASLVSLVRGSGRATTEVSRGRPPDGERLTCGLEGVPEAIDIDLPGLEGDATVEIVQSNLHAMQAIYFSSVLEELRLFQVADKLVELFNSGELPFRNTKGGRLIVDYWRRSTERPTEPERLSTYARCFGFTNGEPTESTNREFAELWLRFLSAVSAFDRQTEVDGLLTSETQVSQETVRSSGRKLAANLSVYGSGVVPFATALREQISDICEILRNDDVMRVYGARDMWQIVDQVTSLELGGPRPTLRYRTMANAGATIIGWLANHANEQTAVGELIDKTSARRNIKSTAPMAEPNDRNLVDACLQWLAVTGTPNDRVEQHAQPVEAREEAPPDHEPPIQNADP